MSVIIPLKIESAIEIEFYLLVLDISNIGNYTFLIESKFIDGQK